MAERYKLLVGLVFPRPIALVSTRSENGVANCAPYSFFNAICEDPMLLILSFSRRSDGKMKHTLANLLRTGEFVVNLVDETLANGMHVSSKEVDEDVSEFSEAGFAEAPCRIADERYRPVGRLYGSMPAATAPRASASNCRAHCPANDEDS